MCRMDCKLKWEGLLEKIDFPLVLEELYQFPFSLIISLAQLISYQDEKQLIRSIGPSLQLNLIEIIKIDFPLILA